MGVIQAMVAKFNKYRETKVFLCVVVAFLIYYVTAKAFFHSLEGYVRGFVPNQILAFIVVYLLVGLPIFVATRLINPKRKFFPSLGFTRDPWTALLFAVICTAPMFLGYAYMAGGLAAGLSFTILVTNNLLAGVFEETYFRGFLFGQLFRHTRLGFLLTIVLCSALFASGHLYQSTNPRILFGILCTTFIGSILFAWLYVEWQYNIWVPMFLHSLMDTSWYLFDTGSNALGGLGANVFRLLTVLLAIVLTVIHKKRTGQSFVVPKRLGWKSVGTVEGDLAADSAVS
jgi:uncharacterized protein